MPWKADVCRVGEPLRFVAVQLRARNRIQDSLFQFIPQWTDFHFILRQVFAGQVGGFPHADNQRHAFRATSPVTLLMSSVDQWREWRFATDVQRANPFRRMKFVAGQRKVVRRNLRTSISTLPAACTASQ